jgi:hypothetical protein
MAQNRRYRKPAGSFLGGLVMESERRIAPLQSAERGKNGRPLPWLAPLIIDE